MVEVDNRLDMNYNNGQDGYMEQEEEWEREGLLDPAWEKQQRKVSTFINLIFVYVQLYSFLCRVRLG